MSINMITVTKQAYVYYPTEFGNITARSRDVSSILIKQNIL